MNTAIVYLSLKPEIAKTQNLPVKLPLLLEDFTLLFADSSQLFSCIPLEMILRGLKAQLRCSTQVGIAQSDLQLREYYLSYYLFFLYEKVKLRLKESDFEAVQTLFDELESLHEKDARYFFMRALYLKKLGFLREAEVELRQVTANETHNPMFSFELARLLEEQNDDDGALEMYFESVKREESFVPALFCIAEIFFKTGDSIEAESYYHKCIQIAKEFLPPYTRLGILYNERQQYHKAHEVFKKALKISPDDAEIQYNHSFSLQRLSMPFEALRELRRALSTSPESVTVLNEIGVLSRKLGLFEESKAFLEKALQIEPENPSLHWNLFWTCVCTSDRDQFTSILHNLQSHQWKTERLLPFLYEKSDPVTFRIEWFCTQVLESYEGIPDSLVQRLSEVAQGNIHVQELTQNQDMQFLDWYLDLLENLCDYPRELLKATIIFNVAVTRSTIWYAFCYSLLELLFYGSENEDDYERRIESLVYTSMEYHWEFSNSIAQFDFDQVEDWNTLCADAQKPKTLLEILKRLLNILWIAPKKEELSELPDDESFLRLVEFFLTKNSQLLIHE